MQLIHTKDHLLFIDEGAEIKKGDYILEKELIINIFPDYLTDLDECSKIIAYRPRTKEAKELDLPLLPPFEEVDIERLAEENNKLIAMYKNDTGLAKSIYMSAIKNFKDGYKAAQSKQFSLEDMKKAIEMAREEYTWTNQGREGSTEWYYSKEQIIQSLSTQQLPSDFIPEYIGGGEYLAGQIGDNEIWAEYPKELKTITNSEGKKELVGKYVY